MAHNNKIIRSATIDWSLGFFRDVMIKMRAKGYEMVALSSPGENLTKMHAQDGFRIIEVPMERHISIWKDLKSLFHLIRVFLKERPLVVHSITPKAGLLCMMAARIVRVPVRIHTFTGLVWPTATGISRRILMTTDWITCTCATHIIPEGEGVKADLQQFITNKQMKVLGFGNVQGVDLKVYNPERFPHKSAADDFIFLFTGRIVGDKGINELVWAFAKLKMAYPSIRLWLIGVYEPEIDPLDEDTMKLISSDDNIETMGPFYGDELVEKYAQADCFVMPSYREGFPNSVLEAGAMELPQIVTDINGSREIVTNELNGLIVPPRDRVALYSAMERMLTDEILRKRLKSQARQIIASRFERSFVQQCQIDYYKEILEMYNHRGI